MRNKAYLMIYDPVVGEWVWRASSLDELSGLCVPHFIGLSQRLADHLVNGKPRLFSARRGSRNDG